MTKKHPNKSQTPMAGSPIRTTDEIFESADVMVRSLDSLIRFLNCHYAKARGSENATVLGFVIERMNVQFTDQVKEVEVQTDFARNVVTIIAPIIHGETDRDRGERRTTILKDFLPSLKEAQIRATVQLYRTLDTDARRRLNESSNRELPNVSG